MSTNLECSTTGNTDSAGNVTVRKSWKHQQHKMAKQGRFVPGAEKEDSLLIDSILSKSEEAEILGMLEDEGKLQGGFTNFTSTQMNRSLPVRLGLSMSPIMDREYQNPSCVSDSSQHVSGNWDAYLTNNRFSALIGEEDLHNQRNAILNETVLQDKAAEGFKVCDSEEIKLSDSAIIDAGLGRALHELDTGSAVKGSGDPARSQLGRGGETTASAVLSTMGVRREALSQNEAEVGGDGAIPGNTEKSTRGDSVNAEVSNGPRSAGEGGCNNDLSDEETGKSEVGESEAGSELGDDNEPHSLLNLVTIGSKLEKIDGLLNNLGSKSSILNTLVAQLKASLEFPQQEIDTLKEENKDLRQKVQDLETEDKRNIHQMNRMEEKLDRVDTYSKKKNLIFEGVPELDGGREDVGKTIWGLFDQLNIDKGMDLDACYRQGNFNKNRTRPIVISFQKQTDRDLVYAKRTNLRKTQDYRQVWVNEDLGQASKKTRNLIRMIEKQAHAEGIDCKTGKYMVLINREKFTGNNLNELPSPLHPSGLKQIELDKDTIAYQSQYAPFSNMYPTTIVIGQYKFISLEQAFQFLKAKLLNKLLAAMRIYHSRDQVEIKQIGDELGTSDQWETKKFDIMYVCLRKKFDQNVELRNMLLATGNRELVEATPNRLWGCGATLSSNLLRRHEWPGENKQGKILMTVREEIRREVSGDGK